MVFWSRTMRLSAALCASAAVRQTLAAPTPECCDLLAEVFSDQVAMRGTETWTTENNDFWSATAIRDPACVFLPESTEQVAEAVTLFVANECRFSIKGGGHSAIPEAANIDDGVLMSMRGLNSIDIDVEDSSVRVGAGVLMAEIYQALDPHNLTAIIGQHGKVGMGLTVAAGISFLMNLEGFAIDNVRAYEVVLADGSVVTASSGNNVDLFRALKGGGNNFGVVTHVTLWTRPTEGQIYGGVVYYPESSLPQVTEQIYDYHIRQAVEDLYSHALPQYGYDGATNKTTSVCPIVYNRDVNGLPESMQGWLEIPFTESTLQKRTYHSLSVELHDGIPDGKVQGQRVFSAYADADLYRDVWAAYHQWLQQYQHIPGFYGLHVNTPITRRVVLTGTAKGVNSLGLAGSEDRTIGTLYFGVTFDNMSDAAEVLPAHAEFVRSMEELAKNRGLWHPYIMLTHSGHDQKAIASYGPDSVAYLLEVQTKYDPDHVFQRLVPGGQKLPNSA